MIVAVTESSTYNPEAAGSNIKTSGDSTGFSMEAWLLLLIFLEGVGAVGCDPVGQFLLLRTLFWFFCAGNRTELRDLVKSVKNSVACIEHCLLLSKGKCCELRGLKKI